MISSDLAGLWYLTRLEADEQSVPQHRVVIRFERAGEELRGTAVTPIGEIPLAALAFDGTRLAFQLQRPTDIGFETLTLMPHPLVLEAAGEKFEGRWIWMKNEVQTLGPRLKLWRSRERQTRLGADSRQLEVKKLTPGCPGTGPGRPGGKICAVMPQDKRSRGGPPLSPFRNQLPRTSSYGYQLTRNSI